MLQLELNLWDQLEQAEATPTTIDFQQLCLAFDAELERMTPKEKLEQGAKAIAQLADLLVIRAEGLLNEWQQRFDPQGPQLEDEDFSDLVRQSFSLDLDELIAEPEATYRLPSETNLKTSLVSEISKDDLLELLEDSAIQSGSNVEDYEYNEDVSAWIATVRSQLEGVGGGQAELTLLIKGTAMTPGMVWMALLLGGFSLRQEGDFYQGKVLVG